MTLKQDAEDFIMDFKTDYTIPYLIAKEHALISINKTLYELNLLRKLTLNKNVNLSIIYMNELKHTILSI